MTVKPGSDELLTLYRCGLGKFCSLGKCKQKEGTPCKGNFPGFMTDNQMEGCNDATEAYCPGE